MHPGHSSTASVGERITDIPILHGRGGLGDGSLQGFSPGQNSTAFRSDLVDIPVPRSGGLQGFRPGQGSRASSSCSRTAELAFDGVFRTFPGVKKKERGPPASAEITRQVIFDLQSRRALQLMRTVPVDDDGQEDFFQDGDEGDEEEEPEMFDESIDRFELSGWRPRRLCCDYMAGCCAGILGLHVRAWRARADRGRASAADHG